MKWENAIIVHLKTYNHSQLQSRDLYSILVHQTPDEQTKTIKNLKKSVNSNIVEIRMWSLPLSCQWPRQTCLFGSYCRFSPQVPPCSYTYNKMEWKKIIHCILFNKPFVFHCFWLCWRNNIHLKGHCRISLYKQV